MQASLVVDCKNQHGEGIFWNPEDKRIWWSDIEGKRVHWYAPHSGESQSYTVSDRVCCFAPRKNGGFVVAFDNRVSLLDDFESGQEQLLFEFEAGNPNTRSNDGRTDRQGRFVIGGMNEKTGAADSSVVRLNADHSVTTLVESIACANSICFSDDGRTMFFADTPQKTIVAFDYLNAEGLLADPHLHCSFEHEPGLPDGSCVDREGGVWNAEWEGRRVVRIAPRGGIDQVVEVPVWKPTCCAFGGDNLDTLYITTSRLMSTEEELEKEPESGGLFAIKLNVSGVEDCPFAG